MVYDGSSDVLTAYVNKAIPNGGKMNLVINIFVYKNIFDKNLTRIFVLE